MVVIIGSFNPLVSSHHNAGFQIASNCVNNLFIILSYSINNTDHHSIHVESAQTTID